MKNILIIVIITLLISCVKTNKKNDYAKTTENQNVAEEAIIKIYEHIEGFDPSSKFTTSIFSDYYDPQDYRIRYSSSGKSLQDYAEEALITGLDFYKKTEYDQAIEYFTRACRYYQFGLPFYYLGLCYMEVKEYETAKASFNKAIKMFENISEASIVYLDYYHFSNLLTYDDNGVIREHYFVYYNIACIESLLNNIDLAYEYLCEALFHGYPYIEHIKRDNDLSNLFRNQKLLQSIQEVYNAGSQNTVNGRFFDLNINYYPTTIFQFGEYSYYSIVYSSGDKYSGKNSYEIKNYLLFSDTLPNVLPRKFMYIRQFEGLDRSGRNCIELTSEEFDSYDEYVGYKEF